jgi:hypothetical protein
MHTTTADLSSSRFVRTRIRLVKPFVYRHPKAWGGVYLAVGIWFVILGAVLCSIGLWSGSTCASAGRWPFAVPVADRR